MNIEDIKNEIRTELTVPVWPHAGQALGLSRNSTYQAVRRKEIPAIRIGKRLSVPTAHLHKMLGLA